MFRLLFVLVAFTISGCMTNSLALQKVSALDLNENRGLLVGCLTRDVRETFYNNQSFKFTNVATGKEYDISAQSGGPLRGKTPNELKTRKIHGGIFIFSLPPGEYTFTNFFLASSSGGYSEHWSSKEPYSIPFHISENKVNYIGEIKLTPEVGDGFLGRKVRLGGYWEISNKRERDSKLIEKKYPFISMEDAIDITPNKKEIFTPFVILPGERADIDMLGRRSQDQ